MTMKITLEIPDCDDCDQIARAFERAINEAMGDPTQAQRDGSPKWQTLSISELMHKAYCHHIKWYSGLKDEDHMRNALVRLCMAQAKRQAQAQPASTPRRYYPGCDLFDPHGDWPDVCYRCGHPRAYHAPGALLSPHRGSARMKPKMVKAFP